MELAHERRISAFFLVAAHEIPSVRRPSRQKIPSVEALYQFKGITKPILCYFWALENKYLSTIRQKITHC